MKHFDDIIKNEVLKKLTLSELERLERPIQRLKLELENEKNKVTKPEPNPDTGEVPLRTGVAHAMLDKKGPKPDAAKDKERKGKVEFRTIKD